VRIDPAGSITPRTPEKLESTAGKPLVREADVAPVRDSVERAASSRMEGVYQAMPLKKGHGHRDARQPLIDEMKPYPSKTFLTVGDAFKQRADRSEVLDHGIVTKVLPEDLKPPRHQVFLVQFQSGVTAQIAHNTDVAPHVPNLRPGMELEIKGEYIYKPNGGVVHWTHHVDYGDHEPGYILVEETGQKIE